MLFVHFDLQVNGSDSELELSRSLMPCEALKRLPRWSSQRPKPSQKQHAGQCRKWKMGAKADPPTEHSKKSETCGKIQKAKPCHHRNNASNIPLHTAQNNIRT